MACSTSVWQSRWEAWRAWWRAVALRRREDSAAGKSFGARGRGRRRRLGDSVRENVGRESLYRRGMIHGMEESVSGKIIDAEVPLAEMFELRSDEHLQLHPLDVRRADRAAGSADRRP